MSNAGNSWDYRKKITIPAGSIDAELTNFPLTVYLNDTNFDFSKAEADGKDIRFTDGELNHLTFERKEHIAGTTKSAVYNVKIPTVSNTEDTEIYMWYGNTSATDTANTTGDVWDDNYVMVQHMGDSLVDATGNGLNATNTGTSVVTDASFGRVRDITGVGTYLSVPPSISNSIVGVVSFTVSMMIKFDTLRSVSSLFGASNGGSANNKWHLVHYYTGYNYLRFETYNKSSFMGKVNSGTWTPSTNTWYSITIKRTANTWEWFINDTKSNTQTNALTVPTPTTNGRIGTDGEGWQFIDGQVATTRVSRIARSDAWIKAESLALKNELLTITDL